jgi:hypothetical protein
MVVMVCTSTYVFNEHMMDDVQYYAFVWWVRRLFTNYQCRSRSYIEPILTNLLGWYCRVVLVGFCIYGGNGMTAFWWAILWKISRRDVYLGENRRPVASHWQTLSHNVVHLVPIDLNVSVDGYSWIAVVRIKFDTNVIIIVIWEKHCLCPLVS